jgi:hypothetical protein
MQQDQINKFVGSANVGRLLDSAQTNLSYIDRSSITVDQHEHIEFDQSTLLLSLNVFLFQMNHSLLNNLPNVVLF